MSSDFYMSTGKKVADFCWGFLGPLVVVAALAVLGNIIGVQVAQLVWTFGMIGWLVGVVLAFTKGRRFIGIGMLCTLLVPLLAVGACFLVASRMRF